MTKNNIAVIDVGTLKSKFEICQFDRAMNGKTLYKDKKLTVLGRDLDKTGNRIVDESIKSTIEALNEFKIKMVEYNVAKYRAVATEAIRRAINATDVLKQIKEGTGIELETLSHEDEAKILFRSISMDFPDKLIAVTDIGGGSVQVVIGINNTIKEVHLFKTGTYYLQEEFSTSHHPNTTELKNTMDYIKQALVILGESKYHPDLLVYGTTNIISFLKAMNIAMTKDKSSGAHPFSIDVSVLRPLYNRIIALSYEERMPMYPEEPYYMWAADKAIMNVLQICDYLNINKVVPSNNNISTAILYELAQTK